MPDDEPHILGLYQQWLYSGCITSDDRGSTPKEKAKEYERLVKCYILGEKLLDSIFKDCIIDTIMSLLMTTHLFDPSLTNLVYDCTPPASPLRKLWLDIYIFCGSPSWLDDSHDPHPDFTIELSRKQMGFWLGARPVDGARFLLEPCTYHEHEDGKCYRGSAVHVVNEGARAVVSALWS